ncbi:hypothetical protein AVEN_243881-1, partial [Araneus ventricosus]
MAFRAPHKKTRLDKSGDHGRHGMGPESLLEYLAARKIN